LKAARRFRWTLLAGALLAFGSIVGCQLLVTTEELQDRRCAETHKICDDRCVPKTDPQTGCAGLLCGPCSLTNASSECDTRGECQIRDCTPGYESCDDKPGCETDLQHDPDNCETCGHPCPKPDHGEPGCSAAMCTIGSCDPGWEDCNRTLSDGCERNIWSNTDCGYCDQACASGTTCNRGTCETVDGAGR
jgi:hypothetical protein